MASTSTPSASADRVRRLDDRQQGLVDRLDAAERALVAALPSDDPLDPRRRFRVESTWPELVDQPNAMILSLTTNAAALSAIADRLARGVGRVFLVGAGDSLAVMMAARLALESMLGVPCEPVQSLEFAHYLAPLVDAGSVVVLLSSSGETTRTVESVLVAQARGAYTIGVTNTAGSTLDIEARQTLLLRATRVGWPTQSTTSALALLIELAVQVGLRRGVSGASELAQTLADVPTLMAETVARLTDPIAEIARRETGPGEVGQGMTLFSGGGPSFATAVVGAAKVKECTPHHALAIQVEEYHHYNSQKVGEPLFLVAPTGSSVGRAVDTGREALRWGGRLYVVTTDGESAFDESGAELLRIPAVPEALSPLLTMVAAQLVGYHLGMAGFAAAEAADA